MCNCLLLQSLGVFEQSFAQIYAEAVNLPFLLHPTGHVQYVWPVLRFSLMPMPLA